ncbi:hypothetical protein FRB90_003998 [Tulasnella sp. 427]|nr:hypothetical protein FRB90_003998 [Tulasnella sp. 427]
MASLTPAQQSAMHLMQVIENSGGLPAYRKTLEEGPPPAVTEKFDKNLPGVIWTECKITITINDPAPHHCTVSVTTEFPGDNNYGGDGILHQGQGQVWPSDYPHTFQVDGALLLVPPPGFDELTKGDPHSIQVDGSEPGVLDFNVITKLGGDGGVNFGGKSKYLEGFKGAYGKITWYPLLR